MKIHQNLYRTIFILIAIVICLFMFQTGQAKSGLYQPGIAETVEIYLPVVLYVENSTPSPTPTPNPGPVPTPPPPPGNPMVYYISPTGSDYNSGTSEAQPWATFNHAWQFLYPGDTLVLLDGTYYQTLNPNVRNGQLGYPITVRAKNDGKAIIDGQYQRLPLKLGDTWPGPIGSYFVIDGIIVQNSSGSVITINQGNHNILRRVSGYNANTDTNSHVFEIWGDNNLIEDCIASGTGRKMVLIFVGENNIVRRCFTKWWEYSGRDFLQCWPWGDGIEIYNADNNIIENSIAFSRIPMYMISLLAQGDGEHSNNNKILGTMAIMAGMEVDGNPMDWGSVRPQPTNYTCLTDFNAGGQRVGFSIYEGYAELRNNLWQDIFAWGNASWGINWTTEGGPYRGSGGHPNTGNNHVNRATIINNGLDNPDGPWPGQFGGIDTDAFQINLTRFDSVTNSRIDKIFIDWPNYPTGPRNMTSMTGEGARLTHRYVNGVLTSQPLWPWPMEQRVKDELGISVTNTMTQMIFGTTNLNDIYP